MQPFKLVAQPLNYKGVLGAFRYTDVFYVLSVIETTFKIAWEKKEKIRRAEALCVVESVQIIDLGPSSSF